MNNVYFHLEDTSFLISDELQSKIERKAIYCVENEGFTADTINFVLCSDSYLLSVNKQYLNHDYYTDVITFDNSENEKVIEGDIFISVDRVKENAQKFKVATNDELIRIAIHGILHLVGYQDNTTLLKEKMRLKENYYLKY